MRSALAISLMCVVASCAAPATPAPQGRTINIEMRDFAFSPESLTLRAGERVTLSFRNVGRLEHEFMAGSDATYGKGYVDDLLAAAHVEGNVDHSADHTGTGIRVAPNGVKQLTFVVPERSGVFEFGCFILGHYETGMRGRLVIDVKTQPDGASGGSGGPQRQPSAAPTHSPMGDDDGEAH